MHEAKSKFRPGRIPYVRLVAPLIDQIPAAVALFDCQLDCVLCNEMWQGLFDHVSQGAADRSCKNVFAGDDSRWQPFLEQAVEGKALSRETDRIERADGKAAWIRWSISPWRDTHQRVRGAMMVCEDITAEMEQGLKAQVLREELSLFIDNAENFGMSMLDDEGRIRIWTAGAARLCGWNEVEVQGQPFEFLFDPGEVELGLPAKQLQLARRNGSFRDRCWRSRKDGTRFLAEVTISRVEGDDVLPSGFGQIVRDITHEDTQARSLEASTVLLRSILDTVPDALIVTDVEGRILLFSRRAEEMFGYGAAEVIGRNVSMLMPPPYREKHDDHLARYRSRGEARVIGMRRRVYGQRKDGTVFPHTIRIGEAVGGGRRMFAGSIQDMTKEEEAEARLEELQRELAHIARVSEMGTLATAIAHQLNQPLMAIGNIVQTSAELLRQGNAGSMDKVSEALEQAGQEALRAGDIVKRLRSFVGKGEIEPSLEDPGRLAREAAELAAAGARYRNIEWGVTVEPGLEKIIVDRIQIQQVLLNLVHNAVEAVDRDGKVEVTVASDRLGIRFTVTDTGPGVMPERIGRLFEPFSTTKRGGMGMGLAICRTIVETHGGRIWYDENLAKGAAFVFTVPGLEREQDNGY